MTLSYCLAVDVGTSRTAAATARETADGAITAHPFPLGRLGDSAPSAVFASDGDLLFGDAAERRGIAEPARLVREFKRRVGDDVPIMAGNRRFAAEEVVALTVEWVVEAVSEREGRLPSAIAVTVPVAWSPYRVKLLSDALARHGWSEALLVSEPEAAARHYESTTPLAVGRTLAIYDLGGGTFDAVVLRKEPSGELTVQGTPVGLSALGGADFDDVVVRHALQAAGVRADRVDADPAERIALAALRRECTAAKEALSFDSEVAVPVLLAAGHSVVRLTRSEFEGMVETRIERTADAFADALENAGVAPEDVTSILLTGGSSRIPRITQMLSERFDRPISIDVDPKAVVALGAARMLAERSAPAARGAAPVPLPEPEPAVADEPPFEELDPVPVVVGKRRRWRIPALPYVAGGSLVAALGLVIGSATALGNPDPAKSELSIQDVLAAGFSAGSAQAAELPVPTPSAPATPTSPTAPNASAPDTGSRTPPTRAPRAAGPDATTPAPRFTNPFAPPASSPAPPTATPPLAPGVEPAQGTLPDPVPTPTPTPTPTPDPTPTTDPTPDPTPTDDPTPDPTPTDDPTPDPTPTTEPDPTPTTEPEPTQPPVEPEPTQPPPSPDPTDPPAPTPSESPTDPVPGQAGQS